MCAHSQVWAIVNASGDVFPKQTTDPNDDPFGLDYVYVIPDLPEIGGFVGDPNGTPFPKDLIVGGTGSFSGNLTLMIGTTVGVVTIGNPSGTLPLIAKNVTIGGAYNGFGRIDLNDFGTTLLVSGGTGSAVLTVGEEGRGELRLANGSRVLVGDFDRTELLYLGGTTVIGEMRDTIGDTSISEGVVTITGFGSRLETEELIVAKQGLGTIQISGLGTLYTTTTIVGEKSDSEGRVSVSGLGTTWTNLGNMDVGKSGRGILDVSEQGLVTSDQITVGSDSFINLSSGGRVLLHDDRDEIIVNGVIRGDGRIESDLKISKGGELRNAATVANERENLLVTGQVRNDGTIESLGGEMEFQSTVTNNLNIFARDAVMRFSNGLTNDGTIESLGGEMEFQSMVTNNLNIIARDAVLRFSSELTNNSDGNLIVGGETSLHGEIDSSGGGVLTVLPDSEILAASDIIFSSSVGSLTTVIGGSASSLTITGEATLDGFLELSHFGAPSVIGDSYDILTTSGGILGTFSNTTAIAGGLIWDITYGLDVVTVSARAIPMPMCADFNGDGIVNGLDLAIWENFYGSTGVSQEMGDADGDGDVDGSDFLKIQIDFGGPPSPCIAAVAAAAAVPEPSTLVLALSALAFGYRRRNA